MKGIDKYNCCADTLVPVRDALDVLNGKWKIPILVSMMLGNQRFTGIQNNIGCISPKVLAKELKDLEANKFIKRVIVEDYPVKIIYQLEPYADTIIPIIDVLRTWGQNHRKKLFDPAHQ